MREFLGKSKKGSAGWMGGWMLVRRVWGQKGGGGIERAAN